MADSTNSSANQGTEMDEVWRDFYQTLHQRKPIKSAAQLRREQLIHAVYMYDQIARNGNKKPVDELAVLLNCDIERAGAIVSECIRMRLLLVPKPGAFRCELTPLAIKILKELNYEVGN